MSNNEAAALIIENIAMLEDANRLIQGSLNETVFAVVDRIVQTWAEEMDWTGVFGFWEGDTGTEFYPKQWQVESEDDEEDWIASFSIDRINDEDDEEWLTSLLGARQSRIGFLFYVYYDQHLDMNKKTWKRFARKMNQELAEIERSGFQFDDKEGTWFLPWKIDARLLAENYRSDSIEDAMEPVTNALAKIKSLDRTFARLVEAARQQSAAEDER